MSRQKESGKERTKNLEEAPPSTPGWTSEPLRRGLLEGVGRPQWAKSTNCWVEKSHLQKESPGLWVWRRRFSLAPSIGEALNNPASNEDNVYRDPLQYHKAGRRRVDLELWDNLLITGPPSVWCISAPPVSHLHSTRSPLACSLPYISFPHVIWEVSVLFLVCLLRTFIYNQMGWQMI